MYQGSGDDLEYHNSTRGSTKPNYADPDYYQRVAKSASPEISSESAHARNEMPGEPYDISHMSEYRGPQSMEGYTVDAGIEQRAAAERGSAEGSKQRRGGLAGLGGGLATLGALLLKFKGLVFLLKFGGAGFSALFSIAVYSLFFGWPFAIGLVAQLFIHEMGHALVMKLKGIPVGGMIFVPMLGAAVTMKQMPQNARDEAEVGIAGPIAGALAASFCLVQAQMPNANPIWAPLAYFGFFMNLFNLIPIVPFDGGRVLAAIDRRIWILGFIGLLAFQIWSWFHGEFSPWLLFFVLMAATQLWSRGGAAGNTPHMRAYYDVPVATRIILSLLYFGLAAVLVLGMSLAHGLVNPLVH